MKMAKLMMCRLCLSQNVRMYSIENTRLQETYETLTNIQLASDKSSQMACYKCYSLLQRSLCLQQQCITTNNVSVQLLQECRVEVTKHMPHRVDREPYKWTHRLEQSQVEIIDSTVLNEGNNDILKSIKKEETIEYEDSLPDSIGGTATETRDQQRISIRDLITFEDSNESEQINTTDKPSENDKQQHAQKINYDDNNGTPPTKRLDLQETYEQQTEDIRNTMNFEGSTLSDISQEPNTIKLLEKNKQLCVQPVDHVVNETINNEIEDSESMLEIINRETSDCEALLNEPDHGKESSKPIYFNCNNCEYQSVTKFLLEKHMSSHDESRRCSYNKVKLKYQSKYHLERTTDKCTSKSDLKDHLLTHSEFGLYSFNTISMFKILRIPHNRCIFKM